MRGYLLLDSGWTFDPVSGQIALYIGDVIVVLEGSD
jgi:hypothetical protein